MSLHLPAEYQARNDNAAFFDAISPLIYQPHVYELAAFVARRCGVKNLIDIGCGSGNKMRRYAAEFQIIGVDRSETESLFRETVPGANFIGCDLDTEIPNIPEDILSDSVFICADVIEHLRFPEKLACYLGRVCSIAPFVFVSTPDRDRVRGWLDCGPPANLSHVMEWNGTEFARFLKDSGFPENMFCGHTINTAQHWANTTVLVIAGAHACPQGLISPKKVAAIIHCYNEVDILPEVVWHLHRQNVNVWVFDNWSTDGTWDACLDLERSGLIVKADRYPNTPTNEYQWANLLRHTEEVAPSIDADWLIHYDADELRYSPWVGVNLAEAIAWVDSLGYNAIDFTVIDFRFLAGDAESKLPYEQSLTHFEFGRRPGHFAQVKAWKNNQRVTLVDSGGHNAEFQGRHIFPLKFLTKHYPLRSASQAEKKIFSDRLPRVSTERSERGWHTQYDSFAGEEEISGWSPRDLEHWAEQFFLSEFLVQRLGGIGLVD